MAERGLADGHVGPRHRSPSPTQRARTPPLVGAGQLRAFTKVALRPGEAVTIELPLERRAFARYDIEAGRWTVAPGAYTAQIGESTAHIVAERTMTLTGDADATTTTLSLDSAIGDWFAHRLGVQADLRLLRSACRWGNCGACWHRARQTRGHD
ncbi:fibronectin type III-like domain-contianing protein [Streptomyces sp. NPDC001700]